MSQILCHQYIIYIQQQNSWAMSSLQRHKLISSAIQFYKTFNPSKSMQVQLQAHPLNLALNLPFHFDENIGTNIGYHSVFSHPQLRLSVFHIPRGCTMKLHNHPKMNVITRVLQGTLEATLFNSVKTVISQTSTKSTSAGKFTNAALSTDDGQRNTCNPGLIFKKSTKRLQKGETHITGPDVDNYHEFSAKDKGCSFIDLIMPDYNNTDRLCTYYNYQPVEGSPDVYHLLALDQNFYVSMCDI